MYTQHPSYIGSLNPNSFQLSGEHQSSERCSEVVVAKALLARLRHIALQGTLGPPALLARLAFFFPGIAAALIQVHCEMLACCQQAVHATLNRLLNAKEQE